MTNPRIIVKVEPHLVIDSKRWEASDDWMHTITCNCGHVCFPATLHWDPLKDSYEVLLQRDYVAKIFVKTHQESCKDARRWRVSGSYETRQVLQVNGILYSTTNPEKDLKLLKKLGESLSCPRCISIQKIQGEELADNLQLVEDTWEDYFARLDMEYPSCCE